MSDFYTPPPKFDPSQGPRPVTPIGEKHDESETPKPLLPEAEPKKKQALLTGSVLVFFKKLFNSNLFSRGEKGSHSQVEIALAAENFKNHLEALKTDDQTENQHFIEELSIAWLILSSAPPKSPLEPFLQAANAYPKGEMHSFAFYLANHAGDTWLPFPFLEILKKLHQGYVLRRKNSELQHLIDLLTDVLPMLTPQE